MEPSEPWLLRIAKVVDHVQTHLDEELTPEQLAEVAGFSLHHFHRVFRGITDESVMGFVRRLRLERAANRLAFEDASVTAIALDSGYGSHEAFTRAFRARFGQAPSAYRHTRPRTSSDHDARLRDEPDRMGIAMRHVGSYDACGPIWGRLAAWAGARGLQDQVLSSLGLCYDDPEVTSGEHLRYDAMLVFPDAVVTEMADLQAGMSKRRVAGGSYAVASHEGPLHNIHETYLVLLGKWLPERSIELVDEPVVEIYVRSPHDHDPEHLLTEVCVRLAGLSH
jgi:AraC family transcriptional regulator